MKQDMRHAGYSETEPKDCTLQECVQPGNKKFLEEVQRQTTFLPPFVYKKDKYPASMLTGESS